MLKRIRNIGTEHPSNDWPGDDHLPGYWLPAPIALKNKPGDSGGKVRVKVIPENMKRIVAEQPSREAARKLLRLRGGLFNEDGNDYYRNDADPTQSFIPLDGPWPEEPVAQPIASILGVVNVLETSGAYSRIETLDPSVPIPDNKTPRSHPHLFHVFKSLQVGTDNVGNAIDDAGVIIPLFAVGEAWIPTEILEDVPQEMRTVNLKGKGAYLYVISYIEGAKPNIIEPANSAERLAHAERIADTAQKAGMTHVLIKVADGIYRYNSRRRKEDGNIAYNSSLPGAVDDCPAVVKALQKRGIQAWGWQYIYGSYPEKEAQIAIQRVKELGLDGFVVNAEAQFKKLGMEKAAKTYMDLLAAGVDVPIGFSSFKYPTYHQPLPFALFLSYCDVNMPQVYPIGDFREDAHSIQLIRSLREYRAINPYVPIIPTGGAFSQSYTYQSKTLSWVATASQVVDFYEACEREGLQGGNLWDWYSMSDRFPELWVAHKEYAWPGSVVTPPIGDGDPPPPVEPPPPGDDDVNISVNVLANPYLNIRKEPTVHSDIVGKLSVNTTVTVTDIQRVGRDLWGKIPAGWIALRWNGRALTDLCL